MPALVHRLRCGVLCLLVWSAPLLGSWLGVVATRPPSPAQVNMFGLTENQHRAMLLGLVLGVVCAALVWWRGRIGWRWFSVAAALWVLTWVCLSAVAPVETTLPGWSAPMMHGLPALIAGVVLPGPRNHS